MVKWLVAWRVGGERHEEEFVYEYNARQWVHVVRWIWGEEAMVTEWTC